MKKIVLLFFSVLYFFQIHAQKEPYLNTALPIDVRVNDLIGR